MFNWLRKDRFPTVEHKPVESEIVYTKNVYRFLTIIASKITEQLYNSPLLEGRYLNDYMAGHLEIGYMDTLLQIETGEPITLDKVISCPTLFRNPLIASLVDVYASTLTKFFTSHLRKVLKENTGKIVFRIKIDDWKDNYQIILYYGMTNPKVEEAKCPNPKTKK